jgi:hypothetical protein
VAGFAARQTGRIGVVEEARGISDVVHPHGFMHQHH